MSVTMKQNKIIFTFYKLPQIHSQLTHLELFMFYVINAQSFGLKNKEKSLCGSTRYTNKKNNDKHRKILLKCYDVKIFEKEPFLFQILIIFIFVSDIDIRAN